MASASSPFFVSTGAVSIFSRTSSDSRILVQTKFPQRCVRAQAAPKLKGIEPPKEEPKLPVAFWGFTNTAEVWNSRAAMLGIIGIAIVELFLGRGILQTVGIEVGKGLNLPL